MADLLVLTAGAASTTTCDIRLHRAPDREWASAIAQLDAAGVPVPLPARPEWARHLVDADAQLLAAYDTSQRCLGVLAVEVRVSRALPGHRLYRVDRGGSALVGPVGNALFAELRRLVQRDSRALQLDIELVLRSAAEHEAVGVTLASMGFQRKAQPRYYRTTLVADLTGTVDDLFASFSTKTRRDLRASERQPVELRALTDPRYADRITALSRETMARTGGTFTPRPWAQRLRLSGDLPERSRIVGLFRSGHDDPDGLLAFAWACHHGDFAHYEMAGSTRAKDIKVSLNYPLLWDLMRWAQAGGAAWFDLGGVTPGSANSDDPLGGISDFKRWFSKVEVDVGEDWMLEPHPARARLADLARRVGRMVGRGA